MNRLLSADFFRLRKSKTFWICGIGMALFAIFIAVNSYYNIQREIEVFVSDMILAFAGWIGIFCAVFCSLFTGTEYSDGTIRNKLAVGHSRTSVYLSVFTVNLAAGLLFCLVYLAVYTPLGCFLLEPFRMAAGDLAKLLVLLVFLTAAFTGLFTAVSMANQNKAAAAVINLLVFMGLMIGTVYLLNTLEAPKTLGGMYMDEAGVMQIAEETPNPAYVDGFQREVYLFLLDFLPTGQGIQISTGVDWLTGLDRMARMLLSSLGICGATILAGAAVFRKKDLK